MALPLLVPLLVGGALLGANVARNKDENILEGALKGAFLGGGASTLGGALGFGGVGAAGAGAEGAKVAATEAGKVAATETAKKAAADAAVKSITPTFTPDATTAIDAGRRSLLEGTGVDSTLLRKPLKYKGVTNIPGSETFITDPTAIAQNNLGTFKATITPPETFVAPSFLERTGSNFLATAKDKPLQTAYFASSVGSALNPQGQTMQAAPYQPGSVQQTPSVEQSINQNFGDQPQFIPRPLFENMQGRSPEEILLLQEQMMARGLV